MTASSPRRVQRRRSAGWRKPAGAVLVTRPSRWGNPFVVGPERTAAAAVQLYGQWMLGAAQADLLAEARTELAGKTLVCWCRPDAPCHADVLLALVNPSATSNRPSPSSREEYATLVR